MALRGAVTATVSGPLHNAAQTIKWMNHCYYRSLLESSKTFNYNDELTIANYKSIYHRSASGAVPAQTESFTVSPLGVRPCKKFKLV